MQTFCRLLLLKCRDEFDNRLKASEKFREKVTDGQGNIKHVLTEEEEEQRAIAKQKMLGNIKFICELGRQGLVQENILHLCIRQLLSTRRDESILSKAEDLECLFQIMKTVGRLLDTEKAKKLMDQYFERIQFYSECSELPSRIRFMLKDIIELRQNEWIPRRIQRENAPKTIHQIREEAAKDLGVITTNYLDINAIRSLGGGFGWPLYGHPSAPLIPGHGPRTLDDMGGFGLGQGAFLGTGPGTIREGHTFPNLSGRNTLDLSLASSTNSRSDHHTGPIQGHMPYRGASSQDDPRKVDPRRIGDHRSGNQPRDSSSRNHANLSHSGLPPRLMKNKNPSQPAAIQANPANRSTGPSGMGSLPNFSQSLQFPKPQVTPLSENISLRPAENSMVLKPNLGFSSKSDAKTQNGNSRTANTRSPSRLDQSQQPLSTTTNHATAQASPVISQKDQLIQQTEEALSQLTIDEDGKGNLSEIVSKLRDMKIPKNYLPDIIVEIIKFNLTKSDKDRQATGSLLTQLRSSGLVTLPVLTNAFRSLLSKLTQLEVDDPLVKTHLAELIARLVVNEVIELKDAYDLVEDKYPMFLLCLQQLHQLSSQTWLTSTLESSKINLMSTLPESDRNKESFADILDKRGLGFLYPLLRIESNLRLKLTEEDLSSANLMKWIKDNVDTSLHTSKGFVCLLYQLLPKFITEKVKRELVKTNNAGDGQPVGSNNKVIAEAEKEVIKMFRTPLGNFIKNKSSLQLAALYGLQTLCYELDFPKGMLLRWFNNLYDLEIIEEDVFLEWKEDINDEFPGKGQALFQVNTWLIWLAETEADSDEEDEEETSDEP